MKTEKQIRKEVIDDFKKMHSQWTIHMENEEVNRRTTQQSKTK